MSKLLYIKANARKEGKSRTFKISDAFIEAYKLSNPDDEIVVLDLYKEGIEFLPIGELENILSGKSTEGTEKILKYTNQFKDADKYVIAAPMWNLSVPAILKAYMDYVTINGITFKYTEVGPLGLCLNKKAIHIVTRGGNYSQNPDFEMGDRYVRTLFAFLGICNFNTLVAEELDVLGNNPDEIVGKAIEEAQLLAKEF